MVRITYKCCLAILAFVAGSQAVDPSAEDRKKWDDKCKATMVFDNNGQPTGTCRAPPYKGCYWGPYKDPKTGQDGCCEKGNGVFSTDPVAVLEGGCCIQPEVYSFDSHVKKGGCCPINTHISWDPTVSPPTGAGKCCPPELVTSTDRATGMDHCCPPGLGYSSHLASGQGECCEPGKTFSFDETAQKGECCSTGQTYKVDPSTGKGGCCAAGSSYQCKCECVVADVDPKCPDQDGKIIQNGGKKWKIFCEKINHGANDISVTDGVASWDQCITNCANNPVCVRAIWKPTTQTCYLRTHGNNQDATFADVYSSAHLMNDQESAENEDVPTPDSNPIDDKKDTESDEADIGPPKHCPEVSGRVVTVKGVTYEIQCEKGISTRFDYYREKTTKDVGECMELCSADPLCQGANLYDDGADEGCVMMKDWEYPATGGIDPSANMMSFVPIQKR